MSGPQPVANESKPGQVWRPLAADTVAPALAACESIQPRSPRWARVCCYLAVFLSFCANAFTLDRYPFPNVDEPFFYYPAIRALHGQGLNYNCRSDVPYGDSVWAYHAPFFPRVLLVSFWLLGENQFACRFPQYCAAHLALLLLCTFLLRRGLFRSGLILALVWIGDYSHYRVLFGRMEGVCLLLLAGAFVALVQATVKRSYSAAVLAGFLLGASVGFHPSTAFFALSACFLVPALGKGGGLARFICLGAGGLMAVALILACWMPSPASALEQFRWGLRYGAEINTQSLWAVLMSNRVMFKAWFLGLSSFTVLVLIPLGTAVALKGGFAAQDHLQRTVFFIAAAFAVSALLGILVLVGSAFKTYYIVCFSVWPIIALLVYLESARSRKTVQHALLAVGAALCACWLPGLRYNAYHVRESLTNYHLLDPTRVAGRLAGVVPKSADATGSPELFFIASKAGLNFIPLPWYSKVIAVPPGTYLLLSEYDWKHGRAPQALVDPCTPAARSLLFEANLAPGTALRWQNYYVFGPLYSLRGMTRHPSLPSSRDPRLLEKPVP